MKAESEFVPPVKIMFRHDKEAGVVRAFLGMIDESEKHELGCLNRDVADKDPELWEAFKKIMADHMTRFLKDALPGTKYVGTREQPATKPHERN